MSSPGRMRPTGATVEASGGHAAAAWSSPPTRSQTRAVSAPVPSPSTCAMRGDVFGGEGGPIRSENSVNTSYRWRVAVHQAVGDPTPTRIAGRNATSPSAIAGSTAGRCSRSRAARSAHGPRVHRDREQDEAGRHDGLLHDDVQVPGRYCRIATPTATGSPANARPEPPGRRCPPEISSASSTALARKYRSSTVAANANHFSCWRSTPATDGSARPSMPRTRRTAQGEQARGPTRARRAARAPGSQAGSASRRPVPRSWSPVPAQRSR